MEPRRGSRLPTKEELLEERYELWQQASSDPRTKEDFDFPPEWVETKTRGQLPPDADEGAKLKKEKLSWKYWHAKIEARYAETPAASSGDAGPAGSANPSSPASASTD